MTLTLIATLETRALADTDGGVSFGGGAPDPQSQPSQPQPATEAQEPAADIPGSTDGNDAEAISDATAQVPTGEEQPDAPAGPGTRPAAQHPDGQQDATVTHGSGGDAGGQAEPGQSQPGQSDRKVRLDDPSVCEDSSCFKPPQLPEDPTTMAAIRPPDDNGDPEDDGEGDQLDEPEEDPLERMTPDERLEAVRAGLEETERILQWLEGTFPLDTDSWSDLRVAEILVHRWIGVIDRDLEAADADAQGRARLRELRSDFEAALQRLREMELETDPDLDLTRLERSVDHAVTQGDREGLEDHLDDIVREGGLEAETDRWSEPDRYDRIQAIRKRSAKRSGTLRAGTP